MTGVGILGLGGIGATHARVIASLAPALHLVAYSSEGSVDPAVVGRARHVTPPELVADPAVDLVVITGPSNLHADHADQAIAAGKAVVVEKPLATTAAEAHRLVDRWRASGSFGSVIAQRRLEPQHRAIKDLLDSGALGQPLVAEVSVLWWRTPAYYGSAPWRTEAPGGGVLMNQALHQLDLLVWLLGPAAEVSAMTANLVHDMAPEDTAMAVVRLASGALATIGASTATRPGSPARIRVRTERGAFALDHATITEWDYEHVARPEPADVVGDGAGDPTAIGDAGHRAQWLDIADALASGRAPAIPLDEGLAVVDLIDAVYRAATSGVRERVGRPTD